MSDVVKGSVGDVLKVIKDIQDKNVYPVFIPSLQKTVLFKEMNTRQEKMIVKTIVDSPVYNSEFIFAIREIIKENVAEELDIDTLTIIDKTAICLNMRMKSIGDEFDYTFKSSGKVKTIKISDYIDEFTTLKIPEDATVGNDNIRILCGYPTIKTEYDLEREFRTGMKELEINTLDDARSAIGNVFTNEIIKYIKEIVIIKDDVEIVLNMEDYNFKNRIAILEEMGNTATSSVLKYIEKANADIRKVLTIELELDKEEQKKFKTEKLTSMLEAGSDFFIIS